MVKRFVCSLLFVLAGLLLSAGCVWAAAPGASLTIESFAAPSSFSMSDNNTGECYEGLGGSDAPAVCDLYKVAVRNTGAVGTDGSPIVVTDTLPAGVTVQGTTFFTRLFSPQAFLEVEPPIGYFGCENVPGGVRCTYPEALAPDTTLTLDVLVNVEAGAAGTLTNTASVTGGGTAGASVSVQNANGAVPASFGVSQFNTLMAGLDGLPDRQAGAHPSELSTEVDLNTVVRHVSDTQPIRRSRSAVHDVRDVVVDLPLGFAGSALATPTCTLAQLASHRRCPPDTAIGYINTEPINFESAYSPIYNIAPEHGVPAEFGFRDALNGSHILYASVVPAAGGYVLRTSTIEVPQIALENIDVVFYGNPAAKDASTNPAAALFTNPSSCSGEPLRTTLHMDSWQAPGRLDADGMPDLSDPNWVTGQSVAPPVTGCDLLHFEGTLTAQPETTEAATPTGLNVELKVPQNEDPASLATPPLKRAVVTLPAGLVVNPSAAGGLEACSLAQIALGSSAQPSCPEASKIGSVEVSTPDIAGTLQGSMYLATQNENPFHTLLAGYIVIDDPTTGVLVKIPGRIDPDPVTGQLVASFDEAPQFPFSDLKLHIFGGPRASLMTPSGCGTYTTTGQLTPWSAPDSGPPVSTGDSFQVTSGCGGGFSPTFTAGTVNNQAGGFSPFTATFSRGDEDQNLSGVSVTIPQGLLGILKGVEQCPEPQANQGTCGAGSLIGHVTAGAGAGPDPFYVQGGQAFLTGPYKGAPFGLSFVVPAVAGPFNLGSVVVRAAIHVDPHSAQITVVSDPLPTILQGIPLDIRAVNVTVDRPGFMFNPTNCEPLTVGGSLTSTQGAVANVSSRFQAANCAALGFHPVFTVSTQAKTTKKNGASLDVKVGYQSGAQANIKSVAVTLPKQLPSRLTTIQQACTEAAFAANPASCPAGSNIGIATAHTPVLAGAFTGPAYLVSHGGAAFPDVVVVLQGEGITLDLVGNVNIKKGITKSDFATVPDAPISSFELSLPEGPHSALAAVVPAKAKGNLCGQSLTMPTTMTGQNGAVVNQNTKIAVTGCPKVKKKAKARAKKRKHGKRK
jgi:uncharacterized repeat protein (TIGR01451 family)